MEDTTVRYEPISVGEWVITLILFAIPIVNIIMLFIWAFSSGTHPSKANFAKAYLLLIAAFIALYVVLFVIIGIGATPQSF